MSLLKHIFVFSILIILILLRFFCFTETSIDKNSNYLIGKIKSINYKNNVFEITVNEENVLVYADKTRFDIFKLEIGSIVKVQGKLSEIEDVKVDRLFSFKKYYKSKKIFYTMNLSAISVVKNNNNIINYLKTNLLRYINSFKVGSYLLLLLGDSSNINSNYQLLGISHLLSISGMHFYLLVYLISKITRNKYIINCFMLFLVFFFGFKVSVLRSYFYYIINRFFPKILSHIYTFLLLLIINPFYIYQSGFIYSVIVSFFISILKNKSIINILIVAFLASLPLNIYFSYSFSLFAIFYNYIFASLINFILFPSLILTFIFPFLDSCCYFIILVFEELVSFCLSFNIIIYVYKPGFIVMFFYYVSLLGFYYKKYFLTVYIIVFICNLLYPFVIDDFVIYFDVNQGDSSLIYSNNKLFLIDTGGYYNSNNVEKMIIPFIHSLGLYKINYLILSHSDYDHMGEAINLVSNFKVEKVVFNCGVFDELELDLIKVLDKKKIPYYSCIKELNVDSNKLYFLNNKDYDNENDNSSVIYTELNNHKFLFMGDAGVEVEEDLIEKYNLKDIDILKVGHHGSKTSSSKSFLDEINPKYSIISVGKNNRYGHPNDSVLNNLDDSKIYRTDKNGSVMFKIKNDKLKIETCTP